MLEYLSENVWLIWILVSVLCLIVELGFGDLFLLCFAIGGLAAALSAAIGLGFIPQLVALAICSLLSIYFVRPVALRYLHRNEDDRISNADAILGKEGRVTQTIEEGGFGRVLAGGDDWKAVSVDGKRIEKNQRVRVVARDSIIITVEII